MNFEFPFNFKLKALREQADLTQQQVADQLHINRSTYAYYETGHTQPSISTLYKLSKILNTSAEYLLNPNILVNEPSVKIDDQQVGILTNREKSILLKLRMLPDDKKVEVLKFIEKKLDE